MAEQNNEGVSGRRHEAPADWIPRPDPTLQTNLAVKEAIAGLKDVLGTRLDALDKVIDILQMDIRDRPHAIEAQISHLRELHEERFRTMSVEFAGVQTQFLERDVRVRESALAATTAINAALQSQKEAAGEQAKSFVLSVDKSERGTLEQIAQQRVLLDTTTANMNGKIEDLKERLTRIESVAVGTVTAKTEIAAGHTVSNQNIGVIVGVIGVVIAVFTVLERVLVR